MFLHRLFGIKSVIQIDCSSTWKIIANPDLSWYHHANPILLLVMYYTLATLIRIWLQEPLVRIKRVSWSCLQNSLELPGDMVHSCQLLINQYYILEELQVLVLTCCFCKEYSLKTNTCRTKTGFPLTVSPNPSRAAQNASGRGGRSFVFIEGLLSARPCAGLCVSFSPLQNAEKQGLDPS